MKSITQTTENNKLGPPNGNYPETRIYNVKFIKDGKNENDQIEARSIAEAKYLTIQKHNCDPKTISAI